MTPHAQLETRSQEYTGSFLITLHPALPKPTLFEMEPQTLAQDKPLYPHLP